MTYEARKTTAQNSNETLRDLLNLGATSGLFRVISAREDQSSYATVETPEGHRFAFYAGHWNSAGKISCKLEDVEANGVKIKPADICVWPKDARARESVPDSAAVSHTRGAAVCLRELRRRVLDNPEHRAFAARMLKALAERQSEGGALREHVATLKALGYGFRELDENETYSARGSCPFAGKHPHDITVYNDGRVTFSAACDVSNLAAVAKLLIG